MWIKWLIKNNVFLIPDKTNDFQSVGQHLEERAHLWFFNPAQTQVAMFFRDCVSGWVPKGGNLSWKRHVYSRRCQGTSSIQRSLWSACEPLLQDRNGTGMRWNKSWQELKLSNMTCLNNRICLYVESKPLQDYLCR